MGKERGYPEISATHLEYREAIKPRENGTKPRLFIYIRDRLATEFDMWRHNHKSKDLRFRWASQQNRESLFGLIEEVVNLKSHEGGDGINNWYTPFRDSVDLKEKIRRHLKALSGKAIIERLIRERRTPMIVVTKALNSPSRPNLRSVGENSSSQLRPHIDYQPVLSYIVSNIGEVGAMNLTVSCEVRTALEGATAIASIGTKQLGPGATTNLEIACKVRWPANIERFEDQDFSFVCRFEYRLPTGEVIWDTNIVWGRLTLTRQASSAPRTQWKVTDCNLVGTDQADFQLKEYVSMSPISELSGTK